MVHEKTIIHFSSKGNLYIVEYDYSTKLQSSVLLEKEQNIHNVSNDTLQARVYENGEVIKLFSKIPRTKTANPTKSQAKELINFALKEIKQKQKVIKNV